MNYKVIIDTSVIVSFALSRNNKSAIAELETIIKHPNVTVLYSEKIFQEYEDVLSRPKFGFDPLNVQFALNKIRFECLKVDDKEFEKEIVDPQDKPFYFLTLSVDDSYLVTGNLKHFPKNARIVSPREFVDIYYNKDSNE